MENDSTYCGCEFSYVLHALPLASERVAQVLVQLSRTMAFFFALGRFYQHVGSCLLVGHNLGFGVVVRWCSRKVLDHIDCIVVSIDVGSRRSWASARRWRCTSMLYLAWCLQVGPSNLFSWVVTTIFVHDLGRSRTFCVARLGYQYLAVAIIEGLILVSRIQRPTRVDERNVYRVPTVIVRQLVHLISLS